MTLRVKNRWQACGIHLLISLLIFLVLGAIILYVWFPGFLFSTDGGIEAMQLLAGVDFIIGPLLTLIVYNPAKKELKRDLTIIGCIQATCLAGGLWLVYQERPIAVVYADAAIRTMSNNSFVVLKKEISDIEVLRDARNPTWVYVDLPTDIIERNVTRRGQLKDGLLHTRTDLYRSFHENLDKIAQEGERYVEDEDSEIVCPERTRKYKLNSRYREGWIAINPKTGKVCTYDTVASAKELIPKQQKE